MLPARHRLTRGADFAHVFRGRSSVRLGTRLLVVHAINTGTRADCPPRVGFAVSRAVGNAVTRNRVKRRLRACVAQRLDLVPSGVDIVVRATPASAAATSADLGQALDDAMPKALRKLSASEGVPVGPASGVGR